MTHILMTVFCVLSALSLAASEQKAHHAAASQTAAATPQPRPLSPFAERYEKSVPAPGPSAQTYATALRYLAAPDVKYDIVLGLYKDMKQEHRSQLLAVVLERAQRNPQIFTT